MGNRVCSSMILKTSKTVVYKEKEVVKEVPAPYPVEVEKKVEVPKRMPLRWWEKIFFYTGIATVGGGIFWLIRKFKK